MPELPEVETTRRGIEPHVLGQPITAIVVRNRNLRQPVPRRLAKELVGRQFSALERRAKYLLFRAPHGTLIVHLGMSGSLRILSINQAPTAHDHVDIVFGGKCILRFRDPRRFGSVLWTRAALERHKLLRHLGPEPWDPGFTGDYLYERARKRQLAVKNFIMDGRIVVGVGNIYASESLFRARIHPSRPAGRISRLRYRRLADQIRTTLDDAIALGGTTLRDFVRGDGRPGYFSNELRVYDRAGEPCAICHAPIRRAVIGQRASFYCGRCQR